ncbi:cysteine desulfurase, SufS subfamily [Aquipluma nitroreducens]|uniref:Cysteine desulfurase n=1 Tax=Aquipluma nitroreducens TaxID=2010828 RepID=A0A5K7SBW7_9BACT|nr:cysteine desulfurase, SufS subfamily [Aquipluma nitroreducens]
MTIEIQKIREDFPILDQKIYKRQLVYFDNAATTQRPQQVIDALNQTYTEYYGNIHRGAHFMADKATAAYEETREKVKNLINAESREQIIFTKGTTESINLAAFSFGEAFVREGDEIIVSEMEHHSNIVPWQLMAGRKGAKIVMLPIDDDGRLQIEKLDQLITPKTKLIAVAHVSNVLGTINPVATIARIAHTKDIRIFVDGAQAAPHRQIDVQDLDVDFYAFSAHKMYGPNGVGVLYGKKELLEQMPPYQGGGEMISEVKFSGTTYNELPYKFEAGTPNISDVIAFGAAIDYLLSIGLENLASWEHELLEYATSKLIVIPGLRIYGIQALKSGVISFNVEGIHFFDLGTMLDKFGIAVRTGHHCADPLMDHFDIQGTVRASFAVYNTKEEIDVFVEALKKVIAMF